MATTIPAKGDRVKVHELTGYVLTQHRPYECRIACECGECNGRSTAYPGVVERVIYWADNSIEAEVACERSPHPREVQGSAGHRARLPGSDDRRGGRRCLT